MQSEISHRNTREAASEERMIGSRLVEMERRLSDRVDKLRDDTTSAIAALTATLHEMQLAYAKQLKSGEHGAHEYEVLRNEQNHLTTRVEILEKWQAAFVAEKAERDRRAEANEGMLRRLGGSLILAFALAVAGATFTAWQQQQTQSKLVEILVMQQASAKTSAVPAAPVLPLATP